MSEITSMAAPYLTDRHQFSRRAGLAAHNFVEEHDY